MMSEWMTGQHLGVLLCIAARSLYGEELPVEWKAAKVDTVTHALEKARERGRARIDTSRRSEWRACEIDMMESWQRVHGTKSVLNWGLGWGFGFPPLFSFLASSPGHERRRESCARITTKMSCSKVAAAASCLPI